MVCLLSFTGYAFAGTAGIEGTVRDANDNLLPNAEIKIEQKDGSAWNKRAKTDAKGRYFCDGLNPGETYRVSLLVGGTVKASINNVKTKSSATTDLNFNLKKGSAAAVPASGKKKTHMVYMPATTGSNLGGRWVEVDDQSSLDAQQTTNVKRAGAGAISSAQSKSGGQLGGGN